MSRQEQGTLSDWDFYEDHVETDINNKQYVGAHSVLIAAGPPELSDLLDDDGGGGASGVQDSDRDIVYPLGIVQNANMSQAREVSRLFEVGSKKSYFLPGRTRGQVEIDRVMFDGRSLLRVLSAYYSIDGDQEADALVQSDSSGDAEVRQRPGSNEYFFVDLASDLFDRPVGLLFYLKNNDEEAYGQFYLENVFINAHQFGMGAGSVIVSESVSMQYENLEPIEIEYQFEQNDN